MRQEHPRIREAGAEVYAVLMGTPQAVGSYCARREVPFRCLADPRRQAYRAFGLGPGRPAQWAGPRVLWRGLRLLARGVATGLPHPGQDVRQMPGTFVVARGGRIRLAHYNRDASDNPPIEVVLGALGAA